MGRTELLELYGQSDPELMGAGFLRRQTRRAKRVARRVTHGALQAATVLPGGKLAVTGLRAATKSGASKFRETTAAPDTGIPTFGLSRNAKIGIGVGVGVVVIGGIAFMATRK